MMALRGATVHPVDDYILVRRTNEANSVGGIVVPQSDDPDRPLRGAIVALGPGLPMMSGERSQLAVLGEHGQLVPVKKGDGVIYMAKDARELRIESGKFDLVRFRDCIAVLKPEK